jgi:pyruvate dehydrogenase E1 component beta subunit
VAEVTYREALNQALAEEMERDDAVFLMGEEVGQYHGAYKVSKGLLDKFGPRRVLDTPISELGFAGLGVGAALVGLRPVIEFMTFNFSFLAIDQVINTAAKWRYMSGGQFKVPIVFRGPNGAALQLAAQHSQACETYYFHAPGIKVVAPSTPADAKGLLKAAIRDDDPVVVLEGELLYNFKGEVPEADADHLVPIGKADLKREGTDVSIITHGRSVHLALQAAAKLEKDGVSVEVLDLRSLRPLDVDAILASVKKTNRAVCLEEGWSFGGVGGQIVSILQEEAFDWLDAPVLRVTQADVPMPYAKNLEQAAKPSLDRVVKACERVLYRNGRDGKSE